MSIVSKNILKIFVFLLIYELYTSSVTTSLDIENNQLLFDALCRRFAIIGEALIRLIKITASQYHKNKSKATAYMYRLRYG